MVSYLLIIFNIVISNYILILILVQKPC